MTGTQVSLIVASLDLQMIKSIRGAINANLPKTGPLGTIPADANPATPRPHVKFQSDTGASPTIAPRQVIHPTPHFEPRPVIHPEPRVVDAPQHCAISPEQSASLAKSNPIKPPWRVIPPVIPDVVIIQTKVMQQKVDVIHKGTLLDLFI
ncbi:MAG: hypothetical protein H7144_11425 [Burkholderiales bacterium]|nr:hypothetical protein [Phycisphaerae bacterium]